MPIFPTTCLFYSLQYARLSSYLFNVDAYLALLRNQPAQIAAEDLHHSIPGTFALWDGNGLDVWAERHLTEPSCRNNTSLYSLVKGGISGECLFTKDVPMLIEDVQSCLVGLQSNIWKTVQSERVQRIGPIEDIILQKESLRRQLNALKSRLDRMIDQIDNHGLGGEQSLKTQYYYGCEDHSIPGWENIVLARIKGLLFNTLMLYYLLSHHLCVDVGKLTQLAKDEQRLSTEEVPKIHLQAMEERKAAIKAWTTTPAARLALCEAADVLVTHQNYAKANESQGLDVNTLHPVGNIVLCTSALIVWTFCVFRQCKCDNYVWASCPIVDLAKGTVPGMAGFEDQRAIWIERGDDASGIRLQLQDMPICQCNINFVMLLFHTSLPHNWGIADIIAPGVFIV